MSKRDSFYDTLAFDGYNLSLPADESERKQKARDLFGALMVASVDVLIEDAGKIVAEQVEFAGFTPEQKEKVVALISHNAYGVLYWQCVKLDRFNGAALEMYAVEHNDAEEPERSTLIIGPSEEELHHSYFDWAEQFGDHYDENSGTRFSHGLKASLPKD